MNPTAAKPKLSHRLLPPPGQGKGLGAWWDDTRKVEGQRPL